MGGNAEYFLKAKDKNQLIEFLREAKKKNIKRALDTLSQTQKHSHTVRGLIVVVEHPVHEHTHTLTYTVPRASADARADADGQGM